jgi:hypothetical protein
MYIQVRKETKLFDIRVPDVAPKMKQLHTVFGKTLFSISGTDLNVVIYF